MRILGNKKLLGGAVAVAMLSGGAGALAATQLSSSNPQQAYINDLANRLHVTSAALTSAMKQAMIDQISAAQKAGRLTAAQASAFRSRIEHGNAVGGAGMPFVPGAWGPRRAHFGACGSGSTSTTTTTTAACPTPPRFHWHGCNFGSTTTTSTRTTSTTTTPTTTPPCPARPFGGRGVGPLGGFGMGGVGPRLFGPRLFGLGASAVTSYLGISTSTLRSDLGAGESLAQIASSVSGKSVAGLEAALTAAAKTRLDKAVQSGLMTSTQEAKWLSALSTRLSKLVNSSFKFPPGGPSSLFRKPANY